MAPGVLVLVLLLESGDSGIPLFRPSVAIRTDVAFWPSGTMGGVNAPASVVWPWLNRLASVYELVRGRGAATSGNAAASVVCPGVLCNAASTFVLLPLRSANSAASVVWARVPEASGCRETAVANASASVVCWGRGPVVAMATGSNGWACTILIA